MEVEIVSKDENQLLDRIEITFRATHAKEGTPQRDAIRDKVASLMKVGKERVVIDSMKSEFGKMETFGYAKVYKSKEAAMRYEREHILVRNKLKEKVGKAKKAPAQEGPAPPAAAPPTPEEK